MATASFAHASSASASSRIAAGTLSVLHPALAFRPIGEWLKRTRARLLPRGPRRLVGLQVEHVAGDQRKEQIAGVEPDAAEHALRRDRTKRIELLEHEGHEAVGDGHRAGSPQSPPTIGGRVCQTLLGASTPSTCSSQGCHFARIVSTSVGVFP